MPRGDFARVEHRDTGDTGDAWFLNGGPVHGRLSRTSAAPGLVEHFFRREYGRLVALLTRKVGVRHIDVVEDAVQSALLAALTAWTTRAFPDDPSAWLYRVAHNNLIGEFRRKARRRRILEQALVDVVESVDQPEPLGFAGEVRDDLLRMLFVCCDDAIPRESQLVFALKTLCGFSTGEIVLRLFTTEANGYKRLARARDRLRKADAGLQTPPLDALESRLPSVHSVLYLLFNEGYLSANADLAIRRELCDEAIRLATLLAEHPVGAVPETFALVALMHLHSARLSARTDGAGGLLLLEEQDRSLWDRDKDRPGGRMAQAVSQWRGVLAIPRGGRHCCGALLRSILQRDSLGRDIRSL